MNDKEVKAIVTVIGKDKKGIIARVSGALAEAGANVEDISQTVMQGYFMMMMLVDISGAEKIRDVRRARISLVTEFCECDAGDLFDGKQGAAFGGEYMRPYEWAIEKEAALCNQYKHAATE